MTDEAFSWVSIAETLLGTIVGAALALLGSYLLFRKEQALRNADELDGQLRAATGRLLWEAHTFAGEMRGYVDEWNVRAWARGLRGPDPTPGRVKPALGSVVAALEILATIAERKDTSFAGLIRDAAGLLVEKEFDNQPDAAERLASLAASWVNKRSEPSEAAATIAKLRELVENWSTQRAR